MEKEIAVMSTSVGVVPYTERMIYLKFVCDIDKIFQVITADDISDAYFGDFIKDHPERVAKVTPTGELLTAIGTEKVREWLAGQGEMNSDIKVYDIDFFEIPLDELDAMSPLGFVVCHDPKRRLGKVTWAVVEVRHSDSFTPLGCFWEKQDAIQAIEGFQYPAGTALVPAPAEQGEEMDDA